MGQKIKSKWIKDLNIKPNAIGFYEENIAKNFVTLDAAIIFGYDSISRSDKIYIY